MLLVILENVYKLYTSIRANSTLTRTLIIIQTCESQNVPPPHFVRRMSCENNFFAQFKTVNASVMMC